MQKAAFTVGLLTAVAGGLVLGCQGRQWRWAVPPPAASPVQLARLEPLPFGPGEELEYEFGWQGIPAATMVTTLSEGTDGGRQELILGFKGKTLSTLGALWLFEASGTTVMDRHTLLPLRADVTTHTRSKDKTVTTRFDWDAHTAVASIQKTRKGKTKEKELTWEAALDLPSALTLLRAVQIPPEGTRAVKVLDGDSLYEVTLTPGGTARVEVAAGSFDAAACDLNIRELSTDEDEADAQPPDPQAPQKYRTMRVWLAGPSRMPVRIEASVPVGHVYADLVRYRAGTAG